LNVLLFRPQAIDRLLAVFNRQLQTSSFLPSLFQPSFFNFNEVYFSPNTMINLLQSS
jgi:hypothetical protein